MITIRDIPADGVVREPAPVLAPGIYTNIAPAEYWAIDAVNWSSLRHMADSPKHYLHALQHPRPATLAMKAGTRFHVALLEPERFDSAYVVLPEEAPRRPSISQWNAEKPSANSLAAMSWWTDWNATNAGKECITQAEYDRAQAMARAVRNDPIAGRYLRDAEMVEVVVIWRDPVTGLLCKARPDLVCRRGGELVLLDPKSCRPSDARLFGQHSSKMGYHCQLAHYKNGLAENDIRVADCGLIGCEALAPHDVGLFWIDTATRELAADTVEGLLVRLAECRASGRWAGRYEEEQTLQMPAYLFGEVEVSYESEETENAF